MTTSAPPPCPACGAPLLPVVYGYPGPGAQAQAAAGLVVLGGCRRGPGAPAWRCPGCGASAAGESL